MNRTRSRHGTVFSQRRHRRGMALPMAVVAAALVAPSAVLADNWFVNVTTLPSWPDAPDVSAIVAGYDGDGAPLYVCRGVYTDGSVHPGKTRSGWGACDFSYGGTENFVSPYSILVLGWFTQSGGSIPGNAYAFGFDTPLSGELIGRPLYPCRATINGSLQLGKIRSGSSGCSIPYNNAEQIAYGYEVLTGGIPLTSVPGVPFPTKPSLALVGGYDLGGAPLYFCQVSYSDGSLQLGKTQSNWGCCDVTYNGGEHCLNGSSFRVLVPDFEQTANVHNDVTFAGGTDSNGSALGVCSAPYNGSQQVGKLLSGGRCYFGYGYSEVGVTSGVKELSYPLCGTEPKGSNPSTNVDYVDVYDSGKTRWCVDLDFWSQSGNASAISRFFTYGDAVYGRVQTVFQNKMTVGFTYELKDQTIGYAACTGVDFPNQFGDTVDGRNFTSSGDLYDPVAQVEIPGFWGYILPLHEAINDFTGLVTGGWPVDWVADDRSPYPYSLETPVVHDVGNQLNSATVLAAAVANNERFTDPSSSLYDSTDHLEVQMFNVLFNYSTYGYSRLQNALTLIKNDGLHWDNGSFTNPSELLTEYVIAYFQLGARTSTDLTQSLFRSFGVGQSVQYGNPPKWTTPYTPNSTNVRAIGTAHCSIAAAKAAGKSYSTQLANLRKGDYAHAVASGGTKASCPAECLWNTKTSLCIAPW